MNPYVFNPYAIAAANLAHYNATAAATASNNQTQTINGTTTTALPTNPYAINPALAQAAALNAYTTAVQQQILNQQIPNTINGHTTALNDMDIDENIDENDELGNTKNQKNKLKVEHDGFYNLKPLLAENILGSDYFKSLFRFKTYHEVIDETQRFCKNVEPLMVGLSRKPSTAFCILYKFFSMELTVRQVEGLLNYYDNPFVRTIGFLYLRYLLPAKDLWKWFSLYLDDEQEFSPGADGKVIKMKEYVTNLLQLQKYYSTLLPRMPVKIERAYKKRLLQGQLIKKRDLENESFRSKLSNEMDIRAQWEDLKWYNAVIDDCLENGKFLVTFTDYDDQCEISIGQIQLQKKAKSSSSGVRHRSSHHRSRSRSKDRKRRRRSHSHSSSRSRSRSRSRDRKHKKHHRSRHHRSRHHHSSRHRSSKRNRDKQRHRSRNKEPEEDVYSDKEMNDDKELEKMVRKKEMEAAIAIGRDYARRPTAYYHSLTLHLETGTNRKRSPTPPASSLRKNKHKSSKNVVVKKKIAPVSKLPSREHLEKMRLLKLKYGDASKR